jgi:hypothetical protein
MGQTQTKTKIVPQTKSELIKAALAEIQNTHVGQPASADLEPHPFMERIIPLKPKK